MLEFFSAISDIYRAACPYTQNLHCAQGPKFMETGPILSNMCKLQTLMTPPAILVLDNGSANFILTPQNKEQVQSIKEEK